MPLVRIVVTDPVATALPMAVPSEKIVTVAPLTVPVTTNCRAFVEVALLKFVMPSLAEMPLSLELVNCGELVAVERLVEFTLKKFSTAAITALRLEAAVIVSNGKPA